ncbi:APC family permease [Gammaproteobacteria bacterium]|nr:APC family permease [Gammaproteobacteria bacterium]
MNTKLNIVSISTFALVMLITGAIDSIRNLPATALFGSSLIFFFTFSAIVFLIPAAMVSAELSSHSTEKSGVFHWIYMAFGEKLAFLAIWLQWVNTMVWFPTILSFIVGIATYAINPNLAQNKYFIITVILSTFWLLTLINLKGLRFSTKFSSFCAVVGMIIPMILIIALAIYWILSGNSLHINFSKSDIIPDLHHTSNWISLTAIMTSFLGIELATVHIKEIKNPQKTFPKALLISVIIILVTMVCGALAIAIVLPKEKINLVNGVMQAFTNFFENYHLSWMIPVITVMLLLGSLGGIISWVISPIKGVMHAAELGFLPKIFCKKNAHGSPSYLLITQAIIVSMICLTFLLMPSVNGSYWLLTALSTELYMLMYVIMFLAAVSLKYKFVKKPQAFTIPGGKIGMWFTCLLGLFGCFMTLFVGFMPPETIDVGTTSHYRFVFSCGLISMISPIIFFYIYKNYKQSTLLKFDMN